MKPWYFYTLWQKIRKKVAGSLQTKLLISFTSMSIFAIVGVGVFSFVIAKKAILFRSFEELTAMREAKKVSIETFIKNKLDGAELSTSSIAMDRIMNHAGTNTIWGHGDHW